MATKLLNNIMTTNKNSILMAFIPQCQKASFSRFQFLKTIYDGSLAVETFYVNALYVSKKNWAVFIHLSFPAPQKQA